MEKKHSSVHEFFNQQWTGFVEIFKQEIWALLSISMPILLTFMCQFGMGITDNVFLGHIGSNELAAAALANTWMWATVSPGLGLSFALDTLVSQAYGAKNYKLVGILLQNALFIQTVICIPIVVVWLYTEDILLLMKIEKTIAELSATFVRYVTPSVFGTMYFGVIQRYLQNQQITKPALICNCIGFFVNIFLDWLFVFGIGWGFEGAAIATTISKMLQPILLWSYMYFRGLHKKTWFGWSKEMFSISRLKTFLRFGSASALMFWFEVLGFEISTFVVGEFHDSSLLSAHSVSFGFLLISFIVPLGLGIGTSIRVGNFLGEGLPIQAKNTAKVASVVTGCCMIFNGIILISFRTLVVRIYTDDPKILRISANLLYFVAAATFFDGMQTMFGSILRGAGHPMVGTVVNLIGYHGVATPLYFVLGLYLHWGLYGIWGGMSLGLFVIAVGTAIAVTRINWEKETLKARERSTDSKANFEELVDTDDESGEVISLQALDVEEGKVIQHSSYAILAQSDLEADETK